MKQRYTSQRSANRGPSKSCFNSILATPVWMRRQQGIYAADSAAFNEKHGIAMAVGHAPAVRGLNVIRRTA